MITRSIHVSGLALLMVLGIFCSGGCRSIGPQTLPRDRFDYSAALAESWKAQMLLNIVKTRYLDLPIFLDVGQVVSGYTLERSGSLGGQISSAGGFQGNNLSAGGAVRYTDRPTITYTPLTGDKFLEGFLTPIQPSKIFSLIQSGYSADFILELGVDSFNGLHNQPVRLQSRHEADPQFYRLITLLAEIQDAGAIGMHIKKNTDGGTDSIVFFRGGGTQPEVQAKIDQARELAGLPADTPEYQLIYSPVLGAPGQLAMGTRSLSQMLQALAAGVDVPESHQKRNLTPPSPARDTRVARRSSTYIADQTAPMKRMHQSCTRISGSGLQTTIGVQSEHSHPFCSSSHWPNPAVPRISQPSPFRHNSRSSRSPNSICLRILRGA